MSDLKEFQNPGEALCYLVECTMASLERAKGIKSTPKSEVRRLEAIVASGLHNCRIFKLADAARSTRCPRVERELRKDKPKVGRQLVLWVPETRLVPLPDSEEPFRVWTLYGDGREDPNTPPALPIQPVHNHGAFMEDYVHDWNVVRVSGEPHLHYASRVCDHSTWILVEYKES